MDDGGGHAGAHVHPFVAQKRLEMQARMEKRLRKRRKSDHEQSPLLVDDALNLGLKILISAAEVPFLVPPNWLKRPHFSQFGGTRNGTSGAEIKILRPPTPPN